MCQTAFISQNIVRLGTRSYKHSLEAMVPEEYSVGQLRRLNRDLDTFMSIYIHNVMMLQKVNTKCLKNN